MAIVKPASLEIDLNRMQIMDKNIKALTKFVEEKLVLDVDYTTTIFQSKAKTRAGVKHKPALLDPGCNKLINFYGVYPDHEIMEHTVDDETGLVHYAVKANLIIWGTETKVAQGVGSCSSKEKRYRVALKTYSGRALRDNYAWTKEQLDAYEAANPEMITKNDEMTLYKVPDQDMLGLDNTIFKMAAKRAEMDGCLQLPGVAAKFTQDIGTPSEDSKEEEEKTPSRAPAKVVDAKVIPKESVEEVIEDIIAFRPNVTVDVVNALIDEEVTQAKGLLTREAAAFLVAASVGVDGYSQAASPPTKKESKTTPKKASPKVAAAMKLTPEIEQKRYTLEEALRETDAGLDLLNIEVKGDVLVITAKKFLGDQWAEVNEAIKANGGKWIRDGKQSRWEV